MIIFWGNSMAGDPIPGRFRGVALPLALSLLTSSLSLCLSTEASVSIGVCIDMSPGLSLSVPSFLPPSIILLDPGASRAQGSEGPKFYNLIKNILSL